MIIGHRGRPLPGLSVNPCRLSHLSALAPSLHRPGVQRVLPAVAEEVEGDGYM